MKKSTMAIGAVVGAIILAGALADFKTGSATGLANAHRAAGYEPSCSTVKAGGDTWALCDIGRSAKTAWRQQGEAWESGNGPARQIIERLEANGPGAYQKLPRLAVGSGAPMPDEVRAKL